MSVDATRRSMLGLGLAVAAGLASAPALACAAMRAAPDPAAFLGQSGDPRDGRVVLGFLATPDEAALREDIAAIRAATRYRRALRSRSTDRLRVAYAKAAVEHLAAQSGIRFLALSVDCPEWRVSGPSRDVAVRRVARELLTHAPSGCRLTVVDNGAPWNFGRLAREAGLGGCVRFGRIRSDDLLQIAEFLTGLAAAGGGDPGSRKADMLARLGRPVAPPRAFAA